MNNGIFEQTEFLHEGKWAVTGRALVGAVKYSAGNIFQHGTRENIENVEKKLLWMVSKCKDIKEIDYMQKDRYIGINECKKNIEIYKKAINDKNDSKHDYWVKKRDKGYDIKAIEYHLKWCQTTYKDALTNKRKELREKGK